MKILITGGAGFIGSNLTAHFLRAGHEVTIFDNFSRRGGEANLAQIYEYVCTRRPTENPAWREQVRKICGERAVRVKRARYSIPELAAKAA